MWAVLSVLLLALTSSQEGLNRTLDELFNTMIPSTQVHIKSLATGFDPIRKARIQFGLLKDDIVWENRGFSDRQISLIAVFALHGAISDAEAKIESLGKKAEEDEENAKKYEDQIYTIGNFIEGAKKIIEREKEEFKFGEMPDWMLKFYF